MATPAVSGCKSVVLDPAGTGSAATDVSVGATGKALILFGQDYKDHQLFTVADADGGIVHAALLVADRATFAVAAAVPKSFVFPRYALNAVDMLGKKTDGVVVGAIGSVAPSAAHRWPTKVGNVVGSPGILHAVGPSAFELMSFTDPSNKIADVITPLQSGSLGNSVPQFFGDSLYWFGNANRRAVQRRWDKDTGPVEFIDYGDDDHGSGNLGTDGTDMVWLEAHGPATKDAFWSTADYWTSPYVKNKADLKPRRLRSEIPNALVGDPIVVGCGRAAFFPSNGVRIVNLSDGSSWFLAEPANGWNWSTALALTCDDVFLRTASAKGPSITRLPIASLGPATPPD